METTTGFCIRKRREGDEVAITELFNRVFSGVDSAFEPRTVEWWRWKYTGNPSGFHSLVAEDPAGAIVAHYGGVPVTMRVDGETLQFGHNCDTFSDPAVRRGLRNPGLFVRLAQAYASTHGRPDDDAVMYGLPSEEAWRVGTRYLDYWMLRSQYLLAVRNANAFPSESDEIAVEVVDRAPDDLDGFAETLAAQYRCSAVRGRAFVQWRFADHPDRPYRIAVARERSGPGSAKQGRIRGFAVHKSGGLIGRSAGLLVDWGVALDDPEAAGALLRFALHETWRGGNRELFFLTGTASPWFSTFQDWGFRAEPTLYTMTARPYDSRIEPTYLRHHWHYTLADFDID